MAAGCWVQWLRAASSVSGHQPQISTLTIPTTAARATHCHRANSAQIVMLGLVNAQRIPNGMNMSPHRARPSICPNHSSHRMGGVNSAKTTASA